MHYSHFCPQQGESNEGSTLSKINRGRTYLHSNIYLQNASTLKALINATLIRATLIFETLIFANFLQIRKD